MREADQVTRDEAHAQVKLFRFGHRLAAVEDASPLGLGAVGQVAELVRVRTFVDSNRILTNSATSI